MKHKYLTIALFSSIALSGCELFENEPTQKSSAQFTIKNPKGTPINYPKDPKEYKDYLISDKKD